eukprot:gene9150-9232_t
MESISLDAIDLQLLNLLQTDAAQSNQALAEQVHVSPPTCLRRVKRLHGVGLIERQVAILQPDRLAALQGHGLGCIVEVSLDRQGAEQLDAFEARAVQEAAVQQCWRVSPGPDFVLVVHTRDMPGYLALSQRLFTGDANVRNSRQQGPTTHQRHPGDGRGMARGHFLLVSPGGAFAAFSPAYPMPTPRRQMPRRIYPLRILGMGLGGMVVAVVLWERQASPMAWTALLLTTLVWPHVAYLLTRRAADPYAAEVRNLLIDSALVAALVPLMHFNLLPSVMLLTLTMVDKITTGIRGLWVRALWVMLAAGVASTAVMGLHWAPETSMRVMVACLPVMSLHTLSVSVVSYQLIRQSARQNQMLDELRRVDALTGLFGRGHWQEQAEAALRRHHTTDEPARDALAIAQRIREQTEGVRLRSLPELRITSSIGVAPADHRHSSLRAWIDAADAALYVAKNGGRNQVAGCMEPALVPAV